MAPDPDEVDIHHRIATGFIGEEVEIQIAVQPKQGQRDGEDREGRNDQHVGAECGPGEDRNLHHTHAGRAHLDDGGDEVNARKQRTHAGNLQGPDIIIHPNIRAELLAGKRRIGQPAGLGEFADAERDVDEDRTGNRQPEAERVEVGESHVARADLKWHGEVHQTNDEGHCHEEDHDHAMGGEDLIIMVRWQEAFIGTGSKRLLGAHHNRIREAAEQHHKSEDDIHDTNALVVNRRQPVVPERGPFTVIGYSCQNSECPTSHRGQSDHDDWLMIGYRFERKFSEHFYHASIGAIPGRRKGPCFRNRVKQGIECG